MNKKNNLGIIIITIVITAIIVGGGVYYWQQGKIILEEVVNNKEKEEPLSYSTEGISVFVSKEIIPFDYSAEQLVLMSQECGNEQSVIYFSDLVSKFDHVNKIVYKFKYDGLSQESNTFVVTLIPNEVGYSSLNEFKKDFDQCYAGGDSYPTMLNNNWLLFVNSCGTGFDDGSGNLQGCDEIRGIVQPTLKLN